LHGVGEKPNGRSGIRLNKPGINGTQMNSPKRTFHELLRSSREAANQTHEVMAVVLGLSVEDYEDLESHKYPDEETLKRLCLINEWNYYDTQRLIINEMITPHNAEKHSSRPVEKKDKAGAGKPASSGIPRSREMKMTTMGDRLREVRLVTGQSIDIISLLLGIDSEHYKRLEEGEPPNDELLRKISVVYNWNYQDLETLLRSQIAKNFQPSRVGMPFMASSASHTRFQQIVREMEKLFLRVQDADQKMALGQLELIRETLRRHQKAS